MRRHSIGALLALAATACSSPVAREWTPPTRSPGLRVVTWNVHDLFDEQDRTAPPGDEDTVLSPAQVAEKLERVGRVLARLDADVYVLEEVETLALLERLIAGPLAGLGYRAWLAEGADPRGIDVGVLARVPLARFATRGGEGPAGGEGLWPREPVEARFETAGRTLVVLGAHLVSRLDPGDDGRRQRQAAGLRALADGVRAETDRPAVLVTGDLNDLPGSTALGPLLGDGAYADLGATLAEADAWTWAGGGARERIDYALLAEADRALVTHVEVAAGPDVAAASDHRPLIVDLWIGSARE